MGNQLNNLEQVPGNLGSIPGVKIIEHKEDLVSDLASVTSTSQDLATMLGVALPVAASEITLVVDPDATEPVHYNPVGTASATNGKLHPGQAYPLFGNKAKLDLAEFFAVTGPVEMSVFIHGNIPAS